MALDPESQRLIDLMAAANRPAWNTLSPQAARELYLALRPAAQGPVPDGVSVANRTIAGKDGHRIPVRLYRPDKASAEARLPALLYAHGGGWLFGNLDSHDVICAQLAIEAGIAVLAVDYRLAPETRFPGAFDDVVSGLQWLAAHGPSIGVDPNRLAIGGDSAGGNLAAAVAIWARDTKGPKLRMQLLAYPVTDMVARGDSYRHFEDGYGLNAATMEWFMDHYVPEKKTRDDWRASPLLHPDLSRLPPALVLTAGFDPLRDEGFEYANRLVAAGNRATYVCFERQIHGFITMGKVIDEANAAVTLCAGELARVLAR